MCFLCAYVYISISASISSGKQGTAGLHHLAVTYAQAMHAFGLVFALPTYKYVPTIYEYVPTIVCIFCTAAVQME